MKRAGKKTSGICKKVSGAALTVILLAGAFGGGTAYAAAGWEEHSGGTWRYVKEDESYAAGEWLWIDGQCYCFDESGWLYMGCITPDGYYVDHSGAWIPDAKTMLGMDFLADEVERVEWYIIPHPTSTEKMEITDPEDIEAVWRMVCNMEISEGMVKRSLEGSKSVIRFCRKDGTEFRVTANLYDVSTGHWFPEGEERYRSNVTIDKENPLWQEMNQKYSSQPVGKDGYHQIYPYMQIAPEWNVNRVIGQ